MGEACGMNFPEWVKETIEKFSPPQTGRVEIALELYKGGITKLEIGNTIRVKPDEQRSELQS